MTKVFLAAGVAALAIAAPASAGPGGHGGRDAQPDRGARGGAQMQMRAERPQRAAPQMMQARPERAERMAQPRQERVQMRAERPMQAERMQRMEARPERMAQQRQERAQMRADRVQRVAAERPQRTQPALRTDRMARAEQAQIARADRIQQAQNARAGRVQQVEMNRNARTQQVDAARADRIQQRVDDRDARLVARNDFRNRNFGPAPVVTAQNAATLRAARVEQLNRYYGNRVVAPATAVSLVGLPLSQATGILPLNPVPSSISYLYPDSSDYYYRYNDGYLYGIDRSSNLIDALIPLIAGGYLPGTTLPSPYMSSYIPADYGWNSFYPNYGDQCTRYANGVVYYVDCATGMIQDVVPVYNNGYGVGQMLPSSYGYYNVPSQYRSMYYDTSDYGYWYAPGAIYQYDPRSSMITSVAALLGQGLTVGQPLPMGYSAYNLPMDYRANYYDSPDAWYRYSNGNVYQVDPTTQLVTAIVASALS